MRDGQPRNGLHLGLLTVFWAGLLLAACTPAPPPTPFVPPRSTQPAPTPVVANTPVIPTFTMTVAPTATITPTPPCTNGLTYIDDISFEDGTQVLPGSVVDKQWLVQNSGSCNWDSRYRLRFAGGNQMGAPLEQALYPALAGTQATLRIVFTAPTEPGTYSSTWQAFGPDGQQFGEAVFMQIVVSFENSVP